MRILKKAIDKEGGEGEVALIPEDTEDVFYIYNLLSVGDVVSAKTFRKVVKESSTGSVRSDRIKVFMQLSVEKIEFEASNTALRVGGRVMNEITNVKKGSYHTLEIQPPRKFSLFKEHWDSVSIGQLEEAANPKKSADVAAIVMDMGLANVCLVSRNMTITVQKIEQSIPKTRVGSNKRDKSVHKFYNYILQAIVQHVDFDVVKAVIIASPGFVKDEFYKWLMEEAVRRDLKAITEHRSAFFLCRASSGFKHSLKEVLTDPGVMERLKDVKASADLAMLKEFNNVFNTDPDRALYSWEHVKYAADASAISHLLITDELFRVFDVAERRKYVELVDSVKENGGQVAIFSTLHPSGEQLKLMTGICAITRFPVNVDHLLPNDSSSDSSA